MADAIMTSWWGLALFGTFVGVFAGLFGLGGGAVMVPLLVLFFGMNQRLAQGTSLAIILSPAAAPAILRYHQGGYVDWWMVLWVAPFLLVGSYLGGWAATSIPQGLLKVSFAMVLTYVAGYMIFSKLDSVGKAVGLSLVPVAVTLLLAWTMGVFSIAVEQAEAGSVTTDLAGAEASAGVGAELGTRVGPERDRAAKGD